MNAIVFYVAGVVSLMFCLGALAIMAGVSEVPKSEMGTCISVALAFAMLAWWAAAGEVETP